MISKIKLPKGTKVPDHVVIIPDGNRRWARARGLTPMEGHKKGAEVIIDIMRAARRWGIHTVTAWGLSTENWLERPKKESDFLMKTISMVLDKYFDEAEKEGVRVIHLGRKDRLPKSLIQKINQVEERTKDNKNYVFNVALDYGGQQELVRAIREIVKDGVKAEDIDVELIDKYMDTADQPYPYPDLIIRTSGEQRTSGVLLWQSHYAETYWENDHLPDFTPEKLREAILDYSRRRRRFGGNDAVKHLKFKPEVTARLELAWWRLRKVPEGTRFRDFIAQYLKEQYGFSKGLAKEAATHLFDYIVRGNKKDWKEAKMPLKKFYVLLKDHLKLAFEPEIVTSLRIKLWQDMENKKSAASALNVEDTATSLFAEEYRISKFQAAKAAHLRVLAEVERNLAESGEGDYHWDLAQDYLQKSYKALKERVA